MGSSRGGGGNGPGRRQSGGSGAPGSGRAPGCGSTPGCGSASAVGVRPLRCWGAVREGMRVMAVAVLLWGGRPCLVWCLGPGVARPGRIPRRGDVCGVRRAMAASGQLGCPRAGGARGCGLPVPLAAAARPAGVRAGPAGSHLLPAGSPALGSAGPAAGLAPQRTRAGARAEPAVPPKSAQGKGWNPPFRSVGNAPCPRTSRKSGAVLLSRLRRRGASLLSVAGSDPCTWLEMDVK
ncbi:collagen alpha-2(I) chain-like [Corvus kubaryi]|uniref:collagen alpha-2(I) chain-like n=1 Tax=Corvus kubaryi TaxID=68294 RepID=UPI001C03EAFC|nr:collagen alpha-2(I) chain-like [Corvus kubaryi]